jgi:Winged helix DNA-binding domain
MRGTLHLLPADELDLWVGARTDYESRRRFPPSFEREHGVTGAQLHAITDAIGEVLGGENGAEPLSRAELVAAIIARLGDPALAAPLSTGWGALLKPAAARGLLCSGPATDGAVSFVSPAAWLGRPVRPVDAPAANREVLLRFLAANGPATAADLARWWGEQPAPARRWIREHADALVVAEVDGEAGFVVRAEDADELAAVPDAPAGDVVLLPGFDPWVLAPRSHRTRAVPPDRTAEVSRTAGWISPVLVVDGAVAGVWEHERRNGELVVTVRPFAPLPAAVRDATEVQAARYGTLLGAATVRVGWG